MGMVKWSGGMDPTMRGVIFVGKKMGLEGLDFHLGCFMKGTGWMADNKELADI